jgi:hypothetical protein
VDFGKLHELPSLATQPFTGTVPMVFAPMAWSAWTCALNALVSCTPVAPVWFSKYQSDAELVTSSL